MHKGGRGSGDPQTHETGRQGRPVLLLALLSSLSACQALFFYCSVCPQRENLFARRKRETALAERERFVARSDTFLLATGVSPDISACQCIAFAICMQWKCGIPKKKYFLCTAALVAGICRSAGHHRSTTEHGLRGAEEFIHGQVPGISDKLTWLQSTPTCSYCATHCSTMLILLFICTLFISLKTVIFL